MNEKPSYEEVLRAEGLLDEGPMGGPWYEIGGPDEATLDGTFTRAQLEALLTLMRAGPNPYKS